VRTETCCEVVTNNTNKTYSCDCWCIVWSDSYVYVTQQDALYRDIFHLLPFISVLNVVEFTVSGDKQLTQQLQSQHRDTTMNGLLL
jgi:hypothetical protein